MHDFIPIFLRTPPQHRWNKPIDLFGPVAFSQQSSQFRASHSFYQEETQEHLLHCPTLRDGAVVTDVPQYDDLLGEETQKIINISRILLSKFTMFIKTPCAPSLSAAIAVM